MVYSGNKIEEKMLKFVIWHIFFQY